jgi:dipeptidyl aminopeptidase/acylaminoacyl peptidase
MRLALLISSLSAATLAAQQPSTPPFDLSVASIMRGPELVGRAPGDVRWSPDGKWLYFSWLPPGAPWSEPPRLFRIRTSAGAVPESVTVAERDSVGPLIARGPLAPDRSRRAVEYGGDLYVVLLPSGRTTRLTATTAVESNPSWSADGRELFYFAGGNAYALTLSSGALRQLTDFRPGPAPPTDSARTAQRRWLEAQQRELFDAIRVRARADSIAKAEKKSDEARRPATIYLDKGETVAGISIAPDGRSGVVTTTSPATTARATRIPTYVTLSGYTEEADARGKVGDTLSAGRLGYLRLPQDSVTWLRPDPGDTSHVPSVVRPLGWDPEGRGALIFVLSSDYKTRYLERLLPDSGRLIVLDRLHDSAWVDGPCVACGGWLPGGRAWFVSEVDGWAHLYSVAADGADRRQLTSGRWEVREAALSPDRSSFYLHTSEPSAYEQHFYVMPAAGGSRRRLTERAGSHEVAVSPDGKLLADVYSAARGVPRRGQGRRRHAPTHHIPHAGVAELPLA